MTRTSLNSQSINPASKSSATFPVFWGDESEDAHESLDHYKRAARLSGWSSANVALGVPLYLTAHALCIMPGAGFTASGVSAHETSASPVTSVIKWRGTGGRELVSNGCGKSAGGGRGEGGKRNTQGGGSREK